MEQLDVCYRVALRLTGQAEHVDSTCRRQGLTVKGTKEMLRLVEVAEVGFSMGTWMGDAAGLYGALILINATSAVKPRFLECRNVTATMSLSLCLWPCEVCECAVSVLIAPSRKLRH